MSGNSRLHRFLKATANAGAHVEPNQENAVVTFLTRGYHYELKNQENLTAGDIAAADPSLRVSFARIVARAATPALPLHRAVFDGNEGAVVDLLEAGAEIDALDALRRTPLTLALQLGRRRMAIELLRRGAAFSVTPPNNYQIADTAYIDDSQLGPVFATRLLTRQIVDTWPSGGADTPASSLARFNSNVAIPFPDVIWNIRCLVCGKGGQSLSGNSTLSLFPIKSERLDSPGHTWLRLQQANVYPLRAYVEGNSTPAFEMSFGVSGTAVIKKCAFNFLDNQTCYPEVTISNPDTLANSIIFHTFNGDIPLPMLPVLAAQGNDAVQIPPGKSHSFDRSEGDIVVSLGVVRSEVFSFTLTFDSVRPPDTDITDSLAQSQRLKVYSRVAALRSELDDITSGRVAARAVEAKTLATAVHTLSAKALSNRYKDVVTELLREKQKELLRLDLRVRDLRDTIVSNAAINSATIDVMLDRLNEITRNASGDQTTTVNALKSELLRLRVEAERTGQAVKVLQDNFLTDADQVVAEYQALILELSQFYTIVGLRNLAPSDSDRAAIAAKLKASEILIVPSAVGGKGEEIRKLF